MLAFFDDNELSCGCQDGKAGVGQFIPSHFLHLLSRLLLLALALPAFQQLQNDILHLLRRVALGEKSLQLVIPQRDLSLQRFFLPHDKVDDVFRQLALGAELL